MELNDEIAQFCEQLISIIDDDDESSNAGLAKIENEILPGIGEDERKSSFSSDSSDYMMMETENGLMFPKRRRTDDSSPNSDWQQFQHEMDNFAFDEKHRLQASEESPEKMLTIEKDWEKYFQFTVGKESDPLNDSDLDDLDEIVKRMSESHLEEIVKPVGLKAESHGVRKDIFTLGTKPHKGIDMNVLDILSDGELKKIENTFRDFISSKEFLESIEENVNPDDLVESIDSKDSGRDHCDEKADGIDYLEVKEKAKLINKKLEALQGRVYRMKSKHMAKHLSEEIGGLFEYKTRLAMKDRRRYLFGFKTNSKAISEIPKRPVPESAVKSFVKSLPDAQIPVQVQSLDTPRTENSEEVAVEKPLAGRRKRPHSLDDAIELFRPPIKVKQPTTSKEFESIQPSLRSSALLELQTVTKSLKRRFKDFYQSIDSDATLSASSSENELDTELEKISHNPKKPTKSLTEYAISKYYEKRIQLLGRIKWLQLNKFHLDDEIEYLDDLLNSIRKEKDKVTSETEIDDIPGSSSQGIMCESDVDNMEAKKLEGSARTRGYVSSLFTKRSLVMLPFLHLTSKRAALPCDVSCKCNHPSRTCALCTGRLDVKLPRPAVEDLSLNQVIASLDPHYHPILSFQKGIASRLILSAVTHGFDLDISVSHIFDDIAARSNWQKAMEETRPRGVARTVWKEYRKHSTLPLPRRRYIKKRERLAFQNAFKHEASSSSSPALATLNDAKTASVNEIQKAAYKEFPSKYPEIFVKMEE